MKKSFAPLRIGLLFGLGLLAPSAPAAPAPTPAAAEFHRQIEPLLKNYCYDCHADGLNKGRVAFDEFESDADITAKPELWLAVLKNVRAGLMPPREEGTENLRPNPAEIDQLANWIKFDAFGVDPADPDPGHVTARRLNRIEYRNTIRDLTGYDFNSEVEFPPDDSGRGFDNNGDVLTVSPLLLEKYLTSAETIVEHAVPKVPRVMRERTASGREFRAEGGGANGENLSAYRAATVSHKFKIDQPETYQVVIDLESRGSFDFDPGHCKVICRVDGVERFTEDVVWHEHQAFHHDYTMNWGAGDHVVSFQVEPLPPAGLATVSAQAPTRPVAPEVARANGPRNRPTRVDVRVASVQVRGPVNPKLWIAPENYARFFPDGPAPEQPKARDAYAAAVLRRFATAAFRRPVDEPKVKQLTGLARGVYTQPGKTFEEGIARAMMAVLASPRFLFRIEQTEAANPAARSAPIDEYSLAARLSYFLWSTMPDDELFRLAAKGELRAQLRPQVTRMLRDPKAQAFVRNFTGQWLEARDVEFVPINARAVLGVTARPNREGRIEFDSALRKLMRNETEMYFDYVVREDRPITEFIESDYTFLNERLATQYGVPGVTGEDLHKVTLPPDSPRGGVLTQGTMLTVTSNPTRTSPVKRGLFVLENILGTPPPPPPPDVPALEASRDAFKGREPKLGEILAVHRANKLCSSCHERMDPIGLAFENFNALGVWRDKDARQPIDPAGKLVTGENFAGVTELKHIIAHDHRLDFYRCMAEKMLTYALGRGVEYYDTVAVDTIVDRLVREDGRMSALLLGVMESVPFQKQRTQPPAALTVLPSNPPRALAQSEAKP